MSEAELSTGRPGAANDDVKFLSEEAEHFLAGILDGIADGMCLRAFIGYQQLRMSSYAHGMYLRPQFAMRTLSTVNPSLYLQSTDINAWSAVRLFGHLTLSHTVTTLARLQLGLYHLPPSPQQLRVWKFASPEPT